jgi:hypothetical protein
MTNNAGRPPVKTRFKQNNPDGDLCLDEFHDVFVACEDLTEYDAAIKLLGSWPEWVQFKNNWSRFPLLIEEWKDEILIKLKSQAMKKIQALAASDDKQALQAAKFIVQEEHKKLAGQGRPTKAAKDRAAKEIAKGAAETKEEEKRILRVMEGGK